MMRLANPAKVSMAAPVSTGLAVRAEREEDFLDVDMAAPTAENWYTLCFLLLDYVKVFYMKKEMSYTVV